MKLPAGPWTRAELRRLPGCPFWTPEEEPPLPGVKGGVAWRSNGGAGRRHPARALPFSLEVAIPVGHGRVVQAALVGVFASCASPQDEPSGAIGGMISFQRSGTQVHRVDLIQGRHYSDSASLAKIYRPLGDGACLESVSEVELDGETHRVDVLTITLPPASSPDRMTLTDLGTPASFVIFDVLFCHEAPTGCTFRSSGAALGQGDIASIVRLKDWPRFELALRHLERGVLAEKDLEVAKGMALTFLGSLITALIEESTDRRDHTFLLRAARSLDQLQSRQEVASHCLALSSQLAQEVFGEVKSSSEAIIHRALAFLERHYAEDLTDARVAQEVGLSTSHFRHLFRQAVKQPFHKYLLSLRLEKAREMILTTELTLTEVAERTGFLSAAHFSRAYTARFGVTPSSMRTGKTP